MMDRLCLIPASVRYDLEPQWDKPTEDQLLQCRAKRQGHPSPPYTRPGKRWGHAHTFMRIFDDADAWRDALWVTRLPSARLEQGKKIKSFLNSSQGDGEVDYIQQQQVSPKTTKRVIVDNHTRSRALPKLCRLPLCRRTPLGPSCR